MYLRYTTFLWRIFLSGINRLQHPYRLNFAITKECHSKCRHCSIWKTGRNQEELKIEEIRRLATSYPHLSWISLTGGEPTDRMDLPEIAKAFYENSTALYLLNFSTNGLNKKRVLAQVSEILKIGIPRVAVGVSIDGPKHSHDSVRGITGSFERSVETLRELFELKREHRSLKVFASMTLFPENLASAKSLHSNLLQFVPNLKASDIHFNLGHGHGHLYENPHTLSFGNFQPQIPRISLLRSFSLHTFLQKIFTGMIDHYLESKKSPIKCAALNASIHLNERGTVFPCTIWDQPLGSLRGQGATVTQVLQSKESRIAKSMIRKSQCPQCWSPCEAYQSIAASPVKSLALSLKLP